MLRLRALREEPTAFASSPEDERQLSIEAVASRLQETASQVMLGAFDGDTLVGLSGLLRERRTKMAHKAWVVSFYVAPEARRRGLGRLLLEHTLVRAPHSVGTSLMSEPLKRATWSNSSPLQ